MAKIGLRHFRYSHLTEAADGTASYDGAKTPGKAISANVSINKNSAALYADDALAESDNSFSSGTITLGIDEDDDATMADLLGHTITDGEMVRNANDKAPYVGVGRIVTKVVSGVRKFKVEILRKVKFGEPNQENSTEGENLEYGTTELEGTISKLKNGDWSNTKTFTDEDDAIGYLESFFASGE